MKWMKYYLSVFVCLMVVGSTSMANEKNQIKPSDLAQKQDWSTASKLLLTSYWVGSTLDAGQTIFGLKKGAVEMNPLLGKQPGKAKIYSVKITVGLLASMLCRQATDQERKIMLATMNVIQWSAVMWNGNQKGIGFQLHF